MANQRGEINEAGFNPPLRTDELTERRERIFPPLWERDDDTALCSEFSQRVRNEIEGLGVG